MVRLWSLSPRPPALFGPSVNRMLGTESAIGLAADDVWDTLVGLLDRFGRAAEDYAARFDVAIAASSLYEMTQDLLDDLLDGGGWTFPEAVRLYDRCLRPLTDPSVAMEGLEADVADLMGPEQDGLERILAEATQELRGLLDSG